MHLRSTSENETEKDYDSSSLASSDQEEDEGDISPLFGSMRNDAIAQDTVRSFVSFAAAAEKNNDLPCSQKNSSNGEPAFFTEISGGEDVPEDMSSGGGSSIRVEEI